MGENPYKIIHYQHQQLKMSSTVESSVLKTITNNQFSSVHVLAHMLKRHEREIQSAINTLLDNNKIYLSVGGVPKRYSAVPLPLPPKEDVVEYTYWTYKPESLKYKLRELHGNDQFFTRPVGEDTREYATYREYLETENPELLYLLENGDIGVSYTFSQKWVNNKREGQPFIISG
jgi:hypothetical protein